MTTIEEDEEVFTEEDFYGLNVLDVPPDQIDDKLQYLSLCDRQAIVGRPTNESDDNTPIHWKECLISNPNEKIVFHLDDAVKDAWILFQEEVEHLQANLPKLLFPNQEELTTSTMPAFGLKDILDFTFGPNSEFYNVFCQELDIPDRSTFVNFFQLSAFKWHTKRHHLLCMMSSHYSKIKW